MPIQPSITTWNRLEPRPRKEEFDRTLRAEVRDGLWMLTRQWQFGEFQAEDAGSPIFTKIDLECSSMQKVSLGGHLAQTFDASLPSEAQMERDEIPLDMLTRFEIGEHWGRLLSKRLRQWQVNNPGEINSESVIDSFYNHPDLKFSVPELNPSSSSFSEDAKILSDREQWQVLQTISHGRALDGGALYLRLRGSVAPENLASWYLGQNNSLGQVNTAVDAAGVEFAEWFESTYYQPSTGEASAWKSEKLEYQFAASLPKAEGGYDVVSAEEYYQGSLDWHSFDLERRIDKYSASLTSHREDQELITREKLTVIPTDIRFPGMPNARWWEMEDNEVDLGDIDAGTTDTAKLLLSEFALIYSNDWMILPYNVAAGSLCEVKSMVVKDVFGQRTIINAAGSGNANDWERWNMFTLKENGEGVTAADTRLFVPPVVKELQESKPVESVSFVRDEMANMVWAVEMVVPGAMGEPKDGFETALQYRRFIEEHAPAPTGSSQLLANNAKIKWELGNFNIPENWIPFITVHATNVLGRETNLRRGALPRLVSGLPPQRIRPRTELLREGLDQEQVKPLLIHEEEIPRSGVNLLRTWQRTRWYDGSVYTWLGRRKTTGRGQANSGMRFDQIREK